jgi:hypothetical protein
MTAAAPLAVPYSWMVHATTAGPAQSMRCARSVLTALIARRAGARRQAEGCRSRSRMRPYCHRRCRRRRRRRALTCPASPLRAARVVSTTPSAGCAKRARTAQAGSANGAPSTIGAAHPAFTPAKHAVSAVAVRCVASGADRPWRSTTTRPRSSAIRAAPLSFVAVRAALAPSLVRPHMPVLLASSARTSLHARCAHGAASARTAAGTDSSASNYVSSANVHDAALCDYRPVVFGCLDPAAINFDPGATRPGKACTYTFAGCTDSSAANYASPATADDGSCVPLVMGCTDPASLSFDAAATASAAGACTYDLVGCTDSNAINHLAAATVDGGSCVYHVEGCTLPRAGNYNSRATVYDGSCVPPPIPGCTDSTAVNYASDAEREDGTCLFIVWGCMSRVAVNLDTSATRDDGSCRMLSPPPLPPPPLPPPPSVPPPLPPTPPSPPPPPVPPRPPPCAPLPHPPPTPPPLPTPPPPSPPPPNPCGWAALTTLCRGLIRDDYARSADECRAHCCADAACEVYQYSTPVEGCCGISCWRGTPSSCDGGMLDVSTGAEGARRISRDFVVSTTWYGGGGANGSAAPMVRPVEMPFGDVVALSVSGGLMFFLVVGAIVLRCRRRSRAVMPVVKHAGGFAAVDMTVVPPDDLKRAAVMPIVEYAGGVDTTVTLQDGVREAPLMRRASSISWRRSRTFPLTEPGSMPPPPERKASLLRRASCSWRRSRTFPLTETSSVAQPPEIDETAAAHTAHLQAELATRRRRAAQLLQRAYREHLVQRSRREWRRYRAVVLVQVRLREKLERRERAARQLQRAMRPRVDEWMAQRAEAKRLTRELHQMLAKQRDVQARAAFASRFDDAGRDVEEDEDDVQPADAMDDYLHTLRAAAGLEDEGADERL